MNEGNLSPKVQSQLDELRKNLDHCDRKILDALVERAEHVQEIGQLKLANGLPIRHPAREDELVEKLQNNHQKYSHSTLENEDIDRVFRNIIEVYSALQARLHAA